MRYRLYVALALAPIALTLIGVVVILLGHSTAGIVLVVLGIPGRIIVRRIFRRVVREGS